MTDYIEQEEEIVELSEIFDELERAKERSFKMNKTEPLASLTLLPLLEKITTYIAQNEDAWIENAENTHTLTVDGELGGTLSLTLISEIRQFLKDEAILGIMEGDNDRSIHVRTLFFALESELNQEDLDTIAENFQREIMVHIASNPQVELAEGQANTEEKQTSEDSPSEESDESASKEEESPSEESDSENKE